MATTKKSNKSIIVDGAKGLVLDPSRVVAYTGVLHEGRYMLSVVEKDVEGHTPIQGSGPYESLGSAQQDADFYNERMGLDKKQAALVVASSMFPRRS